MSKISLMDKLKLAALIKDLTPEQLSTLKILIIAKQSFSKEKIDMKVEMANELKD